MSGIVKPPTPASVIVLQAGQSGKARPNLSGKLCRQSAMRHGLVTHHLGHHQIGQKAAHGLLGAVVRIGVQIVDGRKNGRCHPRRQGHARLAAVRIGIDGQAQRKACLGLGFIQDPGGQQNLLQAVARHRQVHNQGVRLFPRGRGQKLNASCSSSLQAPEGALHAARGYLQVLVLPLKFCHLSLGFQARRKPQVAGGIVVHHHRHGAFVTFNKKARRGQAQHHGLVHLHFAQALPHPTVRRDDSSRGSPGGQVVRHGDSMADSTVGPGDQHGLEVQGIFEVLPHFKAGQGLERPGHHRCPHVQGGHAILGIRPIAVETKIQRTRGPHVVALPMIEKSANGHGQLRAQCVNGLIHDAQCHFGPGHRPTFLIQNRDRESHLLAWSSLGLVRGDRHIQQSIHRRHHHV